MYTRIFLGSNSLRNYSISQTQVQRYLSQTIVSLKPTLTRLLGDARSFGVLKINISGLRCRVCKQNGKIFGERNFSNIAFIQRTKSSLDINTNVTNNVFLYRYDRPKFFAFLNVFAPLQAIFWFGVSYFMYKLLPKRNVNDEPWRKYGFDNFIPILAAITAVFLGTFSSLLLWAFTARSVRYIILQKGGRTVTFITYNPFKRNTGTTVPTENITCRTSRKEMKHYLPVKLKGRRFYYIIDAGGEFTNRKIFDNTIAVLRM